MSGLGEEKEKEKTYHHANVSFVITIDFNSVIHHKIHELVKPTESSNNHSVGIQLNYNWKKESKWDHTNLQ